MIRRRMRVWTVILLAAFALAAVAVPATLAYVTTRTKPVVNTFYVADLPDEKEIPLDVDITKLVLNQGKGSIGPQGFRFLLDRLESDRT